ncbi:MAG TPA: 4-hydroxy-tetrahydrodipicolinate synthase [Rhodothermales bacterium]|nr:4-hydroxy-tetrahydrodipicolinate synthase [Bacteroidota bacterium]HRK74896.1 4-hydroxy-tetrahydrodipicolinate synthase [Rhodothermales bacterium]HRR10166.1 4-hydroxy-tetrahydrodipicolinate synthase [Rhodothermales bacterium]
MIFRGTAPAMVTPFSADNQLDLEALRRHIDFVISGGVEALVLLGTTGENPTITGEERRRIVETAIEHTNQRIPVIIGTGTNDTSDCIRYSREAAAAGADALLIVGPYYNKPTHNGYIAHFAAVADTTDCPIIAYNVPGRTGSNIKAETMLAIAEQVPTVVAVKEASADLAQISDIIRNRPEGFAVYAGDDELVLPIAALGGDGVISVLANAVVQPFTDFVRLCLDGNFAAAKSIHYELLDIMRACFYESNPIPIKTLLGEMGLMNPLMRLPLVPMSEGPKARILDVYRALGIKQTA